MLTFSLLTLFAFGCYAAHASWREMHLSRKWIRDVARLEAGKNAQRRDREIRSEATANRLMSEG